MQICSIKVQKETARRKHSPVWIKKKNVNGRKGAEAAKEVLFYSKINNKKDFFEEKPFLGKWGTTLMAWEMPCNLGSPLSPFSSANILLALVVLCCVVLRKRKKGCFVLFGLGGFFAFSFFVFSLRNCDSVGEREGSKWKFQRC